MINLNFFIFFQFCIALRYFATGASYATIGDCHGVSKTTVHRCVKAVSEYFRRNLTDYVSWPDRLTEKNNKAYIFYCERKQKPGCFGLIDVYFLFSLKPTEGYRYLKELHYGYTPNSPMMLL